MRVEMRALLTGKTIKDIYHKSEGGTVVIEFEDGSKLELYATIYEDISCEFFPEE